MQLPKQILHLFPEPERSALSSDFPIFPEEIRLRAGYPATMIQNGSETVVAGLEQRLVTTQLLETVVQCAANHSIYSVKENLKLGFLPLEGGHRLGLCGTGIYHGNILDGFRNLTSVSIRVASAPEIDIPCPVCSTLILGAPGCGKTTLLRACVRALSDGGMRISVVDERCELSGMLHGTAQFPLGCRTDYICGTEKRTAILMLLRNMNPQWIAVDELTCEEDLKAIQYASYCGVKLLATVHAESIRDLYGKPLFRQLLSSGIFQSCYILNTAKQFRLEQLPYDKSRGNPLHSRFVRFHGTHFIPKNATDVHTDGNASYTDAAISSYTCSKLDTHSAALF